MDAHDLRAGDKYPDILLKRIEASDVLYLFWSRHAMKSPWVEQEWRHGLACKGIEFIMPMPLADPRKVPPPKELRNQIHFDDWTHRYLEYEKSFSLWTRIQAWMMPP